jgi:cation transport regulator ChaB
MPRERTTKLPSTIERSSEKARRTYAETLESAERHDDDEARAHRIAFASLKNSFERVGDRWEPKEHHGPSDAQAEQRGRATLDHPKPTAQGVNANATKGHLIEIARRLEIVGRSRMNKGELVEAIERANRRAAARN